MNKVACFILGIVSSGCAIEVGSEVVDTTDRKDNVLNRTLVTKDATFIIHGNAGRCGATAIGKRTFITAAHCAPNEQKVMPFRSPITDQVYGSNLVHYDDSKRDIAVYQIYDDAPDFSKWLTLRSKPLVKNETVMMYRSVHGGTFTGIVLKTWDSGDWADRATADLPVIKGDSGSAVLDDDDQVVGVVSKTTKVNGSDTWNGVIIGLNDPSWF